MMDFHAAITNRRNRRAFLQTAGSGVLGILGTGLLAGKASAQSIDLDPEIANFALNLEYLEAEYYTYGVTGNSIEALGIDTTGVNTGGGDPGPITIKANPKVTFALPAFEQAANEIALDEQAHVKLIRSMLASHGIQPAARPAIDLLNSFNTLASVAGLPTPFDPFANELNFLLGAYIFEDVGVSAYHGAAALITDKTVLSTAAGILGIEAYHAGLIRTGLFEAGQGAATQAISEVRLALGGSVDYGVAQGAYGNGPTGDASIILSDSNSLAAIRTTRQVLNIVYGGVNATSGLFFPSALNGAIR